MIFLIFLSVFSSFFLLTRLPFLILHLLHAFRFMCIKYALCMFVEMNENWKKEMNKFQTSKKYKANEPVERREPSTSGSSMENEKWKKIPNECEISYYVLDDFILWMCVKKTFYMQVWISALGITGNVATGKRVNTENKVKSVFSF